MKIEQENQEKPKYLHLIDQNIEGSALPLRGPRLSLLVSRFYYFRLLLRYKR
jgi:hypothetical protein